MSVNMPYPKDPITGLPLPAGHGQREFWPVMAFTLVAVLSLLPFLVMGLFFSEQLAAPHLEDVQPASGEAATTP